jgi:hypothetical protein
MNEDHIFGRLVQLTGMEPLDRAVYLSDLYASIRETYVALGASLRAALAVVAETDLEAAAETFGVAPAALVAMAHDPQHPDIALLRRGLQAVRRLPDLPVDSVCDMLDALRVDGATISEAQEIAALLCRLADNHPLDSEIWAEAPGKDRVVFQQAASYARTLL